MHYQNLGNIKIIIF